MHEASRILYKDSLTERSVGVKFQLGGKRKPEEPLTFVLFICFLVQCNTLIRNAFNCAELCRGELSQLKCQLLFPGSLETISAIRFVMGIVCRVMMPGPVTTVLNRLSPPKRTFFTPLIC